VDARTLREGIARASRDQLPTVASAVWRAFGAGLVTEDEAGELQAAIDARNALPTAAPRRRAPPRPNPSASMERRRRWAAAGRMPPKIASHFTLGEQAALAVVAVEVTKRGTCTLAIGAIAALAGVSETTVRRALRQAKVLGFVTVEERRLSRFRNDTNVVSVISREWSSWLRLPRQDGGCQNRKGTNTKYLTEKKMIGRSVNLPIAHDFNSG
jgi:Bacterial regulatory proteins, gntR family